MPPVSIIRSPHHMVALDIPPQAGENVRVRSRRYLVDGVTPPPVPTEQTLVRLSCLEDDAEGEELEERFRYTLTDCLESFPFPAGWESNAELQGAGAGYYAFKAALMVRNHHGLTDTYNRFHDKFEQDGDIGKLRELHDAKDRAVLDVYGWTNIQPTCDVILDYEGDDADAPSEAGKKKKPYRYRWPDDVRDRDEVLARLLALNAERAGATAPPQSVAAKSVKPGRSKKLSSAGPVLE